MCNIFWKLICFVLIILILSISISASNIESSKNSDKKKLLDAAKNYIEILGLDKNCSDDEIITLLDDPNKQIYATGLIKYMRIYSAVPKLLEIVNNNEATKPARLTAAEALCGFGNKDWIPVIKVLFDDKKHPAFNSYKIQAAGLLAKAGDFSQFEIVEKHVNDSKGYVRFSTIIALGKFKHQTSPVTDKAADLLLQSAKNEKNIFWREKAVEGIEGLAKTKKALRPKVIEALEAGLDNKNVSFKNFCNNKLKYHRSLLNAEKAIDSNNPNISTECIIVDVNEVKDPNN